MCVCGKQGEKGDPGLMGLPGARGPFGPKVCEGSYVKIPTASLTDINTPSAGRMIKIQMCVFYPRGYLDTKGRR